MAAKYQVLLRLYTPDPPGVTRDGSAPVGAGRMVSEDEVASESARVVAKGMRALADELCPPLWKFWQRSATFRRR